MIEAVRAWLKRRRKKKQIAKEVAAAAGLIESIELALNVELYEWQRLYIITGIWQPPEGRRTGRTLAYIVRLLIDQSKPLLMYDLRAAMLYADNPFKECQYKPVPTHYADWFNGEVWGIYQKLTAAGVPIREVAFTGKHLQYTRYRDDTGISW